jgi:hypothetical protein
LTYSHRDGNGILNSAWVGEDVDRAGLLRFTDMGTSPSPTIKVIGMRRSIGVRYFGGTQEFLSEDQRAL